TLAVAATPTPPELPKLLTKQDVHNILFLDRNGKYSYYQNRSGGLYLSTNYKIIPIMQGDAETYYLMRGSHWRSKLILEKINQSSTQLPVGRSHEIYTMDFGDTNLKKVGTGIHSELHLGDMWLSYFHPDSNALILK